MNRLAVLISASLVAAVLAIAATPAGACAAGPDDPCLEDPAVAWVKGEVWLDADIDSTRDTTGWEAGWQNTPRVYADLDHDGARDAGRAAGRRREPTARSRSPSTRGCCRRARTASTSASRSSASTRTRRGTSPSSAWTRRAAACATSRSTRARRRPGVELPRRRPGPDQRPDLGRQGRRRPPRGRRGGRRAARRLPRRRPRRRARRGRAVLAQDEHHRQVHPARADALHRGRRPAAAARARAPRRRRLLRAVASARSPGCTARPEPRDDRRARRRPARRDLRPRLRRLADRLRQQAAVVLRAQRQPRARRPGPVGHAARPRRQRAQARPTAARSAPRHAGVSGLLRDVAGGDIYGGASDHFKEIAWPGRAYDYVWDWRKSPEVAVAGLDALVEKARCGGEPPCESKVVRRVSLVGHSMGGLVIRHYIEERRAGGQGPARSSPSARRTGARRRRSSRVAAGVEVPMFSEMDILLDNGGLKAAARSFPGHFALMPAFGYGPWLSVSGAGERQRRAAARHRRRRGVPAPDRRRPDALHARRERARPRARPLPRPRHRLPRDRRRRPALDRRRRPASTTSAASRRRSAGSPATRPCRRSRARTTRRATGCTTCAGSRTCR